MPGEFTEHERTLVAWPAREALWGGQLDRAKHCHANVIRAVARFEPVMVVANLGAGREAAAAVDHGHARDVEVMEAPIDDSWIRDNGPIFVCTADDTRAGVDFRFNGWGEKYAPYDKDDALGARLCERLGLPRHMSPLVLEGGAIAVDGAGMLVTTEQCLLHPTRNPGLGKQEIEDELRRMLGVERIVWLERGLVEDRDTDGHVDNLCAFIAPGVALVQGTSDPANPNAAILAANRACLDAAGIETIVVEVLPYDRVGGREVVVPPLNLYFVNGGVLVPVADGDPEAARVAAERISAAIPDRQVEPVPASVLAYGGGGVHCITQQVPV
ncbi:MAG: agmatine deiminase family protein [Actinobacteria bacterium]|nr:agmatine deiminase family protein [Actinomycetota bacterium]